MTRKHLELHTAATTMKHNPALAPTHLEFASVCLRVEQLRAGGRGRATRVWRQRDVDLEGQRLQGHGRSWRTSCCRCWCCPALAGNCTALLAHRDANGGSNAAEDGQNHQGDHNTHRPLLLAPGPAGASSGTLALLGRCCVSCCCCIRRRGRIRGAWHWGLLAALGFVGRHAWVGGQ